MKPINMPEVLKEHEQALVTRALIETGNNKAAASRLLGINRTTLMMKMRKLNLGHLIHAPIFGKDWEWKRLTSSCSGLE